MGMRHVCAVLLASGLSLVSQATDWPQFLGPQSTGVSTEKGIRKNWNEVAPKKLWSVPMGDNGFTGPAIANGTLFIIDHKDDKDIVRALSMTDGSEKWAYEYAEAKEDKFGFARATPTVRDGRVYTISRNGIANCLEAKSGKLIWTIDILKTYGGKVPQWFIASSPLLDGEKVILCPGGPDATVVALNKKDGSLIWKGGGTGETGYSTPIIATLAGKRQYITWQMERLMGLDPDNGKVLWTYSFPRCASIATPVVIGNSLFITSGYGKGCAMVEITKDGAKQKWENRLMQAHMATPIYADGHIFGNTDPGLLVCLDPATGQAVWKQPGFEKGPLLQVDGVFLAFNGLNGLLRMVEVNHTTYKEIGAFTPLGGRSWTAPILSNGKLVVRNEKTLACFDLH